MNQKLITLLAAAAVAPFAVNAEIELAEGLTVGGYIDIAASDSDIDSTTSTDSGVGEFELDFNYTSGNTFAVAEVAFGSDGTSGFETVVVGWNINDELSISAGNILSYLGFEAYDHTGMYQNTYAYRDFNPLQPAYAVGASIDYANDQYSAGLWVGDSDSSNGNVSYEAAVKYYGIEGLTLFAGYANDPAYETINFWASYEVNEFTFAAEFIDVDNDSVLEADSQGFLFMGNYAVDNYGVTLRYSQQDDELGAAESTWISYTLSPSYTFSDNLMGLVEISSIDQDAGLPDYIYWAVEFIYTY